MAEKDYSDSFLDENFWDKVTRMPETAGCSVFSGSIYPVCPAERILYTVMGKTTIIGALGYLVCSIDAIPDIIPGVGFTDDLAVMTLVVGQLCVYMNDDIRKKVNSMLPERCRSVYEITLKHKD